jgi:hypothetical protein
MRIFTLLGIVAALLVLQVPADAQQGRKAMQGMSWTEKKNFIEGGGTAGKCKYDRCYAKCMEKQGMQQFSNSRCAERCARVMGCI